MIEAVYNRRYHRLTVKGHAGSGEKGHDLVCAAASILVYTLAQSVMGAELERKVRDVKVKANEGDAEIRCTPVHAFKNVMTLIYDSVCVGFDILAQQYPENIKYEVLG